MRCAGAVEPRTVERRSSDDESQQCQRVGRILVGPYMLCTQHAAQTVIVHCQGKRCIASCGRCVCCGRKIRVIYS